MNNLGDEILVRDNFISDEMSKIIENDLLGENFPWFLDIRGTVDSVRGQNLVDEHTFEYPQFFHHIVASNGNFLNEKTFIVAEKILEGLNFLDISSYRLDRIKCNLQTKVYTERLYNTPHRDSEEDHLVMIYYVNDSDGCTYIFENHKKPYNIIKKIQSKRNRVCIFNGKFLHAGSHPKQNIRCLINFNFSNSKI